MKRKLSALFLCLCLLLCLCAAAPAAFAADYLDEITSYDLSVTLQADGSAQLVYDLRWKVLDSTSEGPLEWVKIGVPNQNIDQLTALSSSIKSISPYTDGGDYVRLDLDRAYYAGETVQLTYSLHATHLYSLNDDGSVDYRFTPGWFEQAETRSFTLNWNVGTDQAAYTLDFQGSNNAPTYTLQPGGVQVVWQDMPADSRVTLNADYPTQSVFAAAPLDPQLSREHALQGGFEAEDDFGEVIVLLVVTAFIIFILTRRFSGDYWLGGFFMPGVPHHHHHGGPPPAGGAAPGSPPSGGFGGFEGGSSRGAGAGRRDGGNPGGCACACACVSCACACACAGGGRAGCSAKQFAGHDANGLMTALKPDLHKGAPE